MDASVAQVRYAGFVTSASAGIGSAARFDFPNATIHANGLLSRFESGNLNSAGTIGASLFSGRWGVFRPEYGLLATGARQQTIGGSGSVQGSARLHWLPSSGAGLWFGGSSGATSSIDRVWSYGQGELGAWTRHRNVSFTLVMRPTAAAEVRYADMEASLRWVGGRFDAGVQFTARGGDAFGGDRTWGYADAIVRLTSRIALVGSGGRLAADAVRGSTGARFLSAGVRIATRPAAGQGTVLGSDGPLVIPIIARPDAERFEVRSSDAGGAAGVRVIVPGARRVELMADFTDWLPVVLSPDGNEAWRYRVALAPGVYRVNIRIDGGAWVAPPGLTAAADEFDGVVGLLVVREP